MTGDTLTMRGKPIPRGMLSPCVVKTIANITLSGEQTIDTVAVVAGDRVLVAAQTDASENGIYDVANGAWVRAKDFNNNNEIINGQSVAVTGPAGVEYLYQLQFSGSSPTVGTTEFTFTAMNNGVVVDSFSNVGGELQADALLRPKTNNTRDFGTTLLRWKDGWFAGTLVANAIQVVTATVTTVTATTVNAVTVAATGAISGASAAITNAITAASITVTGAVTGASAAITNAITAASVTVTGAVTGASAAISGALTAGSAAITGAVTAASATISGTVTAAKFIAGAGVDTVIDAVSGQSILFKVNNVLKVTFNGAGDILATGLVKRSNLSLNQVIVRSGTIVDNGAIDVSDRDDYLDYQLHLVDVSTSGGNLGEIHMQYSTDGGSSWETTGYTEMWRTNLMSSSGFHYGTQSESNVVVINKNDDFDKLIIDFKSRTFLEMWGPQFKAKLANNITDAAEERVTLFFEAGNGDITDVRFFRDDSPTDTIDAGSYYITGTRKT